MTERVALQDPAETLDYALDWSAWLAAGDTIATSAWTITPSAPALTGAAIAAPVTSVLVGGLTLAGVYRLENTIVTAMGDTQARSITIRCFPE